MANSILARLRTEHTPLIDHDVVTFIWRGGIAPKLVGDFTGWEDGAPIMLEKTGRSIWSYQLTLPLDAYIEYIFIQEGNHLDDPYNPRRTHNGVGGYNNYFSLSRFTPTELVKKNKEIPQGIVTSYTIPTEDLLTSKKRTVHLYKPPVSGPLPLIVVWDGQDYLHRAHLSQVIDNLIYQKIMQPVALVFVENGGQKSRTVEYACSEATLVFLMTEVLPLIAKEVALVDIDKNPGAFGVLGASMGGLMALYTAIRIPHVFGNVLCQSGAYSWAGFDMVVFDLLEHGELLPIKIWMDVGTYDIPGLLVSNQRMSKVMMERGYPLIYHEYNAGHNYTAWVNDVWRGLEALFGNKK